MIQTIGILTLIFSLAVFSLQLAASIWVAKNYKITFPLFLVTSTFLGQLLAAIFSDESARIIYQMTDVRGIPTELAVFRVNLIVFFTRFLGSLSILLVTLVGISEILEIAEKLNSRKNGFWRRFSFSKRSCFKLGVSALVSNLIASSFVGVYYHLI